MTTKAADATDPKPQPQPKLVEQTNDAKPDPRELARLRAQACGEEIMQILAKHRCRIVPFLKPLEPIGNDGTKALVEATFGVVPNEV